MKNSENHTVRLIQARICNEPRCARLPPAADCRNSSCLGTSASVQHAKCIAVFTCTCHTISGMLWNVGGRWAHVEGEGALVPGPGVLAGVEGHQVGRPRLCSSHVGAATIEVLKLCTGLTVNWPCVRDELSEGANTRHDWRVILASGPFLPPDDKEEAAQKSSCVGLRIPLTWKLRSTRNEHHGNYPDNLKLEMSSS